MKTLGILALIIVFFSCDFSAITHFFSHINWPMHIHFDGFFIEPVVSIITVIVAVVSVVAVGLFLAVGFVGIIVAVLLTIAVALLLSGVAALWPLLLFGLGIWLLVGEKKQYGSDY